MKPDHVNVTRKSIEVEQALELAERILDVLVGQEIPRFEASRTLGIAVGFAAVEILAHVHVEAGFTWKPMLDDSTVEKGTTRH